SVPPASRPARRRRRGPRLAARAGTPRPRQVQSGPRVGRRSQRRDSRGARPPRRDEPALRDRERPRRHVHAPGPDPVWRDVRACGYSAPLLRARRVVHGAAGAHPAQGQGVRLEPRRVAGRPLLRRLRQGRGQGDPRAVAGGYGHRLDARANPPRRSHTARLYGVRRQGAHQRSEECGQLSLPGVSIKKDEVAAVVELLTADGFDTPEQMARAVLNKAYELFEEREWHVIAMRNDGGNILFGPY